MGFMDKLWRAWRPRSRGRTRVVAVHPPPARPAGLLVRFERGEFEFDGEEGERVSGTGFNLHDEQGLGIHHEDERLAAMGIHVFKVAGVSYRQEAIQGPACAPGSAILLVREPENRYDPNAIG